MGPFIERQVMSLRRDRDIKSSKLRSMTLTPLIVETEGALAFAKLNLTKAVKNTGGRHGHGELAHVRSMTLAPLIPKGEP
jgi:hypothetical protein